MAVRWEKGMEQRMPGGDDVLARYQPSRWLPACALDATKRWDRTNGNYYIIYTHCNHCQNGEWRIKMCEKQSILMALLQQWRQWWKSHSSDSGSASVFLLDFVRIIHWPYKSAYCSIRNELWMGKWARGWLTRILEFIHHEPFSASGWREKFLSTMTIRG